MKKERMKQSLLALALAGVLLVSAMPLAASAFDSGLDQGAEFNLSLGNTENADSAVTQEGGNQSAVSDGDSAPQGSGTVEVAGIPVPTYEEFLALSDGEKLALFDRLNALDDDTLDSLTPEQQARVEPIFQWATEQTATTDTAEVVVIYDSNAEKAGDNSKNYLLLYNKNGTATLKTDGTISLTVDGTTYTVPGTALGRDSKEHAYNYMSVTGTSVLTLELEDAAQTWTWTKECCPIELGGGSIQLETTSFWVNTGSYAFLNKKSDTLSISDATITNEGTGPVVRGEGGGSLNLNNVTFASKGRAVELADCNSSKGTPSVTIIGGTITGSPAVYAGSANDKESNVTIQGATLYGNGGNGIYVSSNVKATLTNTTIRNCNYGVYVEAKNSNKNAYATIGDCTITDRVNHMAYLYTGASQEAYLTIGEDNTVTSAAGADIVCGAVTSFRAIVGLNVKNLKTDNRPWLVSSQYDNSETILGESQNIDTSCIKAYDPHCHIYTNDKLATSRIALSNHNPDWSITSDSNKGTITAYCKVDGCKFYSPMTLTATVEKSHIYDGKAVSATVTGADAMTEAGLEVTTEYYKGNTKLSAAPSDFGGYTAKVSVKGGDQSGTLELPFAIVAPIEGNSGLTYNHTAQELVKPVASSDGIKIYYKLSTETTYSTTIPTGTNAGTYTVQYYMTDGSGNAIYGTADSPQSLTVTIAKAKGTITFETLTFVYDGKKHEPHYTQTGDYKTTTTTLRKGGVGVPGGAIAAGTYNLEVTLSGGTNYADCTASTDFTITPKTIGITWSDTEFIYDGSSHIPTATATGLIGQDTCTVTVTGAGTNAGNHTATATGVSNSNYKLPDEGTTRAFTIAKFTPTDIQITGAITNSLDLNKVSFNHTVKGPKDTTLPGRVTAKDGQTLTWGTDGKCTITCVFTPTDTTNIAEVEVENVTVQLTDTEGPEVTYTLNGESWNNAKYLNTDAQVIVSVTDAVSGFQSGKYAVQWDGQSSLEWKSIPENGQVTVTVPAEHGKSFQIKVQAEDKAGNGKDSSWTTTSCYFITQPPVIDLDANKTYYVSTKFSVSGLEITSVTRKNNTNNETDIIGSTSSDNFLLPGNTDTTYTVTATDKAGNKTEVTVTMKPIESILDPLTGVTVDNVTTDQEKTVENIESLRGELSATSGIKTQEIAELNDINQRLSQLQDRINTVKDKYNEALKYESITPETVTRNGLDDLQAAGGVEEVIDGFVRDYEGNLTADQKAKLAEIKQNLKAAQDLLKQVSDMETEINALPNSVEPDDVDAVTRVRDVRSARASLSDHAQELIDSMCNAKLDALWAQATAYKIIKGDGKVWVRSEGDYEVVANGPYDWFARLLIDGETVESDSYTAASGSTVVTLPKAYMDDLKDGKHTVVFVYENDGALGQAEGNFTVQTPAGSSPRTGDENNMLPYGIAIVAALAALIVLFVPKKRKKQ